MDFINILSSNEEVSFVLSKRIKRERIAQNLKQIDLAKRANVKLHVVRNFEQHSKISLDNLISIIRALRKLDVFDKMFDFANQRVQVDAFEYQQKIAKKESKRVYSAKQ